MTKKSATVHQRLLAEILDPMTGTVVRSTPIAALPEVDSAAGKLPDVCLLVVDGDCMAPAMHAGDVMVVRDDRPARPGRPAAFKPRGWQAAVKLWAPQGDEVYGVPTNRKHRRIGFRASDILWALEVLFLIRIRVEGPQAGGGKEVPVLSNTCAGRGVAEAYVSKSSARRRHGLDGDREPRVRS